MNVTNADPSYYSIGVSSMGSASYWSIPRSDARTGAPDILEFTVSSATRSEVFRLTQELSFFQGHFKNNSSAGYRRDSKSLTFAEGPIHHQITFGASKNPSIKQLTTLFERISATMELGRTVERLRTGNPRALPAALKVVERKVQKGKLAEFQAIAPVIQRIASDTRISGVSRQYARAILEKTGTEVVALRPSAERGN
jgi:hypothetical protein